MTTVPSSDRIHFLDPLRVVMMGLGVVLHAAQVFNPYYEWKIQSPQTLDFCYYLVTVISIFRMPVFMLVAGLAYAMMLKRGKRDGILREKFQRIGVPLLTSALTLNLIEWGVLRWYRSESLDLWHFLADGRWMSHLWFLVCLLYYYVGAEVVRLFVWPHVRSRFASGALLLVDQKWILLLLLPFLFVALLSLFKIGVPPEHRVLGSVKIYTLVEYLPFFVFGVFMGGSRRLLMNFVGMPLPLLAFAFLAALFFWQALPDETSLWRSVAFNYFEGLLKWVAVFFFLGVFSRWFKSPSRFWSDLSRVTYSVYIFHHVLVVLLGIFLIWLALPSDFAYWALVLAALLISLFTHKYVVARSPVLMWLFNGMPIRHVPQPRVRSVSPSGVV